MNVIIRANANSTIGWGHVMRTRAIAQAWIADGGEVTYITDAKGSVRKLLGEDGCEVIEATSQVGSVDDESLVCSAAEERQSRFVIVDDYGYEVSYLNELRDKFDGVAILDDYQHLESYPCDLVLNQNVGAQKESYSGITNAKLLLGLQYALLRREFLENNFEQVAPPEIAKRILVTMGGADPQNIAGKVVRALRRHHDPEMEVLVLTSSANPNLGELQNQIFDDHRFKLELDCASMPIRYQWADLSICAGGSSNWEMCFFGVPRLVLVLAENQVQLVRELSNRGGCLNLGWAEFANESSILESFVSLAGNQSQRIEMANASRKLVDGFGATRVVKAILAARIAKKKHEKIELRAATTNDSLRLWNWRNDEATRNASRNTELVTWSDHQAWLSSSLASPKRKILIGLLAGQPVGTIRLDKLEGQWEVSWTVAPEARGFGIGKKMVAEVAGSMDGTLRAVTRVNNIASQKIAMSAGFELAHEDGEFKTYRRPCLMVKYD